MSSYLPGVLLLDLHGHGHNHDFIEVGYRLTADILNAISDPQVFDVISAFDVLISEHNMLHVITFYHN